MKKAQPKFTLKALPDYKLSALYQECKMKSLSDGIDYEMARAMRKIEVTVVDLRDKFPGVDTISVLHASFPSVEAEEKTAFDMLRNKKQGFLLLGDIRCKMEFNNEGDIKKILKIGIVDWGQGTGKERFVNPPERSSKEEKIFIEFEKKEKKKEKHPDDYVYMKNKQSER